MKYSKRIGVFGGTFDPIHNTHIDIAQAAMSSASLDLVFFVIAASPPHKQHGVSASPEQRYQMVEAALKDQEGLEPCDIEFLREGPSYTAITLSVLADQYPESELFLIVGLDSLVDIPNWREPDRILQQAHVLAVARPNESRPIPPYMNGHYDLIPFEDSPASSTEVRRRIRAGAPLNDLVPESVIELLQAGSFYA